MCFLLLIKLEERERDVIKMIIRIYEYCLCVLLLIKWERERGEGGIF